MRNKEIQINDIWNDKKKDDLKKIIVSHSSKQSKEQVLKNELLSIQYKLEDYIQNENDTEILKILDFVKMYLKVLNLSKKRLATYFDMKDSNLHKYLIGERKLNAKLVLKLSTFSHTKPEQWYKVQLKNEMMELNKEKANTKEYEKYDYRHLVDSI
ncbi:transcriptional regulator [Flavobacterium sp. Fl-318]|jgi:plasmid maintenance system antidote protein VapI|uniref:Transcriptional regulator n=1 Tax=Flavobacterium cupriresistens TaxID=2893885 RepID=A0ABU4R7M3_9FLAO|nr:MULTISPECIES: transcriptional regulator [unclassified Flavobacterium]MDX6188592.1 transcriptional regulator [Flavobacterium sp. Fl-318]UFH44741.1 transcriptional regulator [Flavobacterium sp. F-323]